MGQHCSGEQKITIQQLTPRHRSMVRAVAAGLTPTQIGRIYGMCNSQVSIVCNSPAFLHEVARIEEVADEKASDLREELLVLRDISLSNLKDDLLTEVDQDTRLRSLRQKASLAVLELIELKKKGSTIIQGDVTINTQNNNNLTVEELNDDVFNILQLSEEED